MKGNEKLNAMKEQSNNAWELTSKKGNEFHKYYEKIENKYKDALVATSEGGGE